MHKKAFVFAVLSMATVTAALAEEAKSDWTLTGNAGLFSDYRFRGFTQTAYKPAFQGGFDLTHVSGFYLGNWNSNVEQQLYRGASLEMDFYGGYKYPVGSATLDVGGYYYYYPSSNKEAYGSDKLAHQAELYFGATSGDFSAKLSYGLSNFFGLGDGTSVKTSGNYYLDLGYGHDLGQGYGVNAHYGYQYVKNGTAAGLGGSALTAKNVSDYRLGITKDLSGWSAGATLVATSKKDFAYTGNSLAAGDPKGAGKTSLVLSMSKTF